MEQTKMNQTNEKERDTFFTASTIVDWYEEFVPSNDNERFELYSELYY